MTAVDEGTFARDRSKQHRLRERPAKRYIMDGAGDAVGISLDLVTEDDTSNRSRSADFDHGPSKPYSRPL
jgi:hypothetical protein